MRKRREAGFTLVELAVVLVVMGIAFGIAVTGTTGMVRSSRLTGASSTLVSDLRYARSLATTQRKNYGLLFRPGGYALFRASPPDTVLRRTFPTGVACTATDTAMFFAWGLSDPVTITLTGYGRSKAVLVSVNGNASH